MFFFSNPQPHFFFAPWPIRRVVPTTYSDIAGSQEIVSKLNHHRTIFFLRELLTISVVGIELKKSKSFLNIQDFGPIMKGIGIPGFFFLESQSTGPQTNY